MLLLSASALAPPNPLDPLAGATAIFMAVLGQIGAWYQQVVAWVQSGEFLLTTGSAVSYAQPDVMAIWHTNVLIGDGLLTVLLLWVGYSVMLLGNAGPLQMLSRMVLAAVGSHASLFFAGLLIELNNGMCRAVLPRVGFADLAAFLTQLPLPNADPGMVFQSILVQIFASMVDGEMYVRLAVLNVLMTLLPYAFLLYVLPELQGIANFLFGAFFAVVFLQFLNATAFELSIKLLMRASPFSIVQTITAVATLTFISLIPRWLGSAVTGSIGNNIRSDHPK